MGLPLNIIGSGLAVPPRIQTHVELAPAIGRSAEWIADRTGVLERRVADPDLDLVDLAAEACRAALGSHGPPDLILFASSASRQTIPDTSVFLQRALGFEGLPSYSIHATCVSFLVALNTAAAYLASGTYTRILICSAELGTRVRNLQQPESAALLGDGAAAVLVEGGSGGTELERFRMRTWPAGAELAQIRGGGLLFHPNAEETRAEDNLFDMDGTALYRMTLRRLREFVGSFLEDLGGPGEVDLIVPHQASGRLFRVLRSLGFAPERTVNILPSYGNCAAASIPMGLAAALDGGRIARGDKVLLLGTAAGLTIAAGLLRW